MQKKNWILLGLIAFLITATLLAWPAQAPPQTEESTCCQKNDAECVEQINGTGEMLPENLSRQFIFMLAPLN